MNAAHSNIGPSSAERWFNCPGSVAFCARLPAAPKNVHAAEGTVAHELAEELVSGKVKFQDLSARVGRTVEQDGFTIEITEEMVDAALVYHDVIHRDYSEMRESAEGEPPIVAKAEVRVRALTIDPDLFGTADYLLYQKGNRMKVYDFKYGKGVIVNPERNKQMAIYAVAAMDSEAGYSFKEIELVVVQPRAGGDPVRRWIANNEAWIAEFRDELKTAVKATKGEMAVLTAGKWCRWCAAKPHCHVAHEAVQKQAMVDFADTPPAKITALPDVSGLSMDKLTEALEWQEYVESWFEAARQRVRGMLDAGIEVPGYKLVSGKSNRKWLDERTVVAAFSGILGEEEMFEKKLLSPAKLEKIVGKGKLDAYTFKPEASKTVAKEDDARPAVKNSAQVDFGAKLGVEFLTQK